jgi:hypothetical protein
VSTFFALLAIWLFVRGQIAWSLPALAYAAMIKPPLAALAPIVALAYLLRDVLPHVGTHRRALTRQSIADLWKPLRGGAIGVLAAACVVVIVPLPFGVGVPPITSGSWTLFERMNYALNVYAYTTLNAFNIWTFPFAGNVHPDNQPAWLGLNWRTWGTIWLAAAFLCILALFWRWYRRAQRPEALVWACATMMFATFMLPTRVHERYLFPSFALFVLLGAIAPAARWLAALVSLTYLANLYYVQPYPNAGPTWIHQSDWYMYTISLLHVVMLSYALFRLPFVLARESPMRGTRRQTAARAAAFDTPASKLPAR